MSHSAVLKMEAEDQINLEMMNSPMKIRDAATMYRRPVSKNEPPYDAEIKRLNNRLVDEWYEKVLMKIADSNACVPAGRITACMNYFLEGKEVIGHQKHKDFLMKYSKEQVEYWIKFLTNATISDMRDAGTGVVAAGWSIIKSAIRDHFLEEKWENIYSKSEDPLEWDKMANNNPRIMNPKRFPFGLTKETLDDINEKVRSFLIHPIEPK